MFVLESGFFNTPTWGAIVPQSIHLLQSKPFPLPSQKSLEQWKEVTDHKLPSATDLVFRGLYCPYYE